MTVYVAAYAPPPPDEMTLRDPFDFKPMVPLPSTTITFDTSRVLAENAQLRVDLEAAQRGLITALEELIDLQHKEARRYPPTCQNCARLVCDCVCDADIDP